MLFGYREHWIKHVRIRVLTDPYSPVFFRILCSRIFCAVELYWEFFHLID